MKQEDVQKAIDWANANIGKFPSTFKLNACTEVLDLKKYITRQISELSGDSLNGQGVRSSFYRLFMLKQWLENAATTDNTTTRG